MKNQICVICGMSINEKNYNFNREAFIDENKWEDIKYCPFCGVSKYFIQIEEPYNFNGLNLDEKELNIIDHAVKLEIYNGDFYEKASKIAQKEKVKKIFKALSNVEFMHAKIHANIGGFKHMPKLRDMDYSKYKTEEQLLEEATLRERHAVAFYSKYIKEMNNVMVGNVFEALSEVELLHIELTENS